MKSNILHSLAQGDMRTTGTSNKIVMAIVDDQEQFNRVFSAVSSDDKGLAMRAADAAEKASGQNPSLLPSHITKLLQLAKTSKQQEVQWHVAQMLERLELSPAQQKDAFQTLADMYETAKSRIVKASALQALVHIVLGDSVLEKKAFRLLNKAAASSIPSTQARARKLIKELEKQRNFGA